jgi:mRNA interferase RelE/StbE
MKYEVIFAPDARRTMKKLDRQTASMIYGWVEKNLLNTEFPRQHGKALAAELKELWRYRVGDYRLIARIEDERVVILILSVGHRREVYR